MTHVYEIPMWRLLLGDAGLLLSGILIGYVLFRQPSRGRK